MLHFFQFFIDICLFGIIILQSRELRDLRKFVNLLAQYILEKPEGTKDA